MARTIFYSLVIGAVGGVLIASLVSINWWVIGWVGFVGLVLALVAGPTFDGRRAAPSLAIGLVCITAALGMTRFVLVTDALVVPQYETQLQREVVLTGTIAREPDVRTRSQHLYLQTEQGKVLVIADRYLPLAYGDVITVTGIFERPEAFTTDLGRTFDYPGYVAAQGAWYMMRYPEVILVSDTNQGNRFISGLLWCKHQLQTQLERILPEPHGGLAQGLLLGEKQALGSEWNETFRKAGIIHIVVLSGYNVMLVVTFCLFIFARFFGLRGRAVAGIIAIICFALIVGLSATVVRASIMAGLVLVAAALGRSYAIMRGLLLAGAVMILINPYLLVYDPGFQLSFLATLGLIVVAPYLETKMLIAPQTFKIREFLVATIATQIAVLPWLLYQIGELSVVALVVNVLVLPIVAVAMLGTFVTGLLGFVSEVLASLVGYGTYLVLEYILIVAKFFADLPGAALVVPVFSIWWVVLAYALMGYWWWRYHARSAEVVIVPNEAMSTAPTTLVDDWEIVEVRR